MNGACDVCAAQAKQKALSAFMQGKTTHEHTGARRERTVHKTGDKMYPEFEDIHGDAVPSHLRHRRRVSKGAAPAVSWRALGSPLSLLGETAAETCFPGCTQEGSL